jgi:hypothetical protein
MREMMTIKFEGRMGIGKTMMLHEFSRILRGAGYKCWMEGEDDNTLVVDMADHRMKHLLAGKGLLEALSEETINDH